MNQATQTVQKRYDRFSYFYDFLERGIEKKLFSALREKLVNGLKGDILEIGVGTGKNLAYYSKGAKVTGIDISPKMLAKAKQKIKSLDGDYNLLVMDAQHLKFKDRNFDYVLCTFVLCSVPDPIRTLKEMKRVCKKGGKIIMVEHVLSDNWFIAFFQHVHNPLTRVLFGFNVNRRTVDNVKRAGLEIKKEEDIAFFDVFKRIEVKNE